MQIISTAQLKKKITHTQKKSAKGLNACLSKEVIDTVTKAHETMLSITSSLRKAKQICYLVSPHFGQNGYIKNRQQ